MGSEFQKQGRRVTQESLNSTDGGGGFSPPGSSSDTVFETILSRWKRRFSRMPCVSMLWRRCAIFVGSGGYGAGADRCAGGGR